MIVSPEEYDDNTYLRNRGVAVRSHNFLSSKPNLNPFLFHLRSPTIDFFTDFTSSETRDESFRGKISGSLSYYSVSAAVSASSSRSSKITAQSRVITSTMKIERYYSSVREEISPLSYDAFTLLERQDYVGFFNACGPNYVRSIRRAQEVTAIFKFTSTDTSTASSFAMSLQVSHPIFASAAVSRASSSRFRNSSSSLVIDIIGFGMGLNQEGSETLVATSLEEVKKVMMFSFKSMTQNDDADNIGMVYGMEVVPWVNNLAFQVAAKVAEENVIIPMPRSLMARAFLKTNHSDYTWVQGTSNRSLYRCKDDSGGFEVDRYGFCCEDEQLYDPSTKKYPLLENPPVALAGTEVCRPVYNLDKALVKDNMANNGEFVARLDNAMRYKLAQIGSLEKCITAAKAIPSKYLRNYLKSNDSVKYDKDMTTRVTAYALLKAVDPLGDYGMLRQLGRELDEWIEMYYGKCLGALYGMGIGATPDPDASLFMAYPWHSYSECMMLSCVINNMRWDRRTGSGCVPSVITGYNAPGYSELSSLNTHCAMNNAKYGPSEECKYNSAELKNWQTRVKTCWNNTQAVEGIDHLLNHFCNPQLTPEQMSQADHNALVGLANTHCS